MTTITASPGGVAKLPYKLNYSDVITLDVDWSTWLGDDTITSASWDAETGVTAAAAGITDTSSSGTITAGTTITGKRKVLNQITTLSGRKRSIAIQVEVTDLIQ